MVSLYLVSFSLVFIMHLTSVYLVPLLLVGLGNEVPETLADFARGKVSRILGSSRRSVGGPEDGLVSKRSVEVEGDGGGTGIADNSNHQSVYHQHDDPASEDEDKKRGNYLIQEYLVSFLPYCPNGYQITIEPDQAPQRKGRTAGILFGGGEEAGKYILCQQNGRAKIKVSSHHRDDDGRVNHPGGQVTQEDTTYWITKAEALTPLQDKSLYNIDSLDADAQESQLTKELMDTNCLPRKCPSNQLMAINTKNHMDCSSFYICIMGHHFLLHCPQGHLFSEEYGVCVETKYSDCQVKAACTNRL